MNDVRDLADGALVSSLVLNDEAAFAELFGGTHEPSAQQRV
jgi:hypothetical protein